MEIRIQVTKILPSRTFTTQKGETTTYAFIGKTNEQYPKEIKFDVWGTEKWNEFAIQEGKNYVVSFNLQSRCYNGAKGEMWFTTIDAWKAFCVDNNKKQPQGQAQQEANNEVPF